MTTATVTNVRGAERAVTSWLASTGRAIRSRDRSLTAQSGAINIGYLRHGTADAAVTHAPVMAAVMSVELTGQWHLLPIILPCNLLASLIARTISPESLYAIASPESAQ
jgi:CIC family chloride channel protein